MRAHGIVALLALGLAGCAGAAGLYVVRFAAPAGERAPLTGMMARPSGPGPFPAVVLLHTCSGLWDEFERDWARWFAKEGYVPMVVDSFTSRGVKNMCAVGPGPTPFEMAMDALAALDHLQSLDFVAPDRISVVGWSYGASAALTIAAYQDHRQMGDRPPARKFHAAVAFYPPCSALSPNTIPTLLLLAGRDNWTPSGQCVIGATTLKRDGRPIEWIVYPEAHHSFDRSGFGAGVAYLGYTQRYDPAAAKDAEQQVRRFLGAR
jgi:dienelactone hydrolase